jgi:DNA-binding MarR family transcriptional regulator
MQDATIDTATRLPYGVLLARLGNEATAGFRRALRPLGLGAQEFIVVKQLQAIGPTSQASVADALGIDYSNLAAVVGSLEERKLVERTRDEADRRRYILRLSEAGAELIATADQAIVENEEQMLAVLSDDERAELWELLRRVADAAKLCPSSAEEACVEAAAAEACLEESRAEPTVAEECLEALDDEDGR